IKDFFLNYNSYSYRDFVMRDGGNSLEPAQSDIHDWTIRFVDTGLHANIGQRLLAVRKFLEGEEAFLANYSDQLTDFQLPELIRFHEERNLVAAFLSARPASQSMHNLEIDSGGIVTAFGPASQSDYWINGGYM